jgi:3'(2'), 5'-bisphosphate nucleotidase
MDVSRVVVYVDPLDGTNEYAGGEREAVTCLMGVAVDGTPVAGIIGQPFHGYGRMTDARLGRTVWGGRGVGVLGLGEVEYTVDRPKVDANNPNPPVVCVNRITREHRQEAVMAALGGVVGVKISATGFHYLNLLEGRAHCALLLREGVKKWDTCAGEALLRAVGGAVTDTVGRPYDYTYNLDGVLNLSGMTASVTTALHRHLTATIRRVIAPLGDYPYDIRDPSVRPPLLPPPPRGGYRALTVDVGGCLLTPAEPVTTTYTRLAVVHGFTNVTEASAKAAIRAGFAAPPPLEQRGVRYVGDGKSFWRPLVAAAMGGATLDDPKLEAVLSDLYRHYEDPANWHVAPGAKEAFADLRGGGVKATLNP